MDSGALAAIIAAAKGAPAAPAAPAPVAQTAAPAPASNDIPAPPTVEFEATGDVGLDMALEFIGGLGIDDTNPMFQAAMKGDFSALETYLSAQGDKAKGYQRYMTLAKEAYAKTTQAEATRNNTITQAVTAAVGGAEQWKAIREWAQKNADPHEREAINKMLTGDVVSARAAAMLLQQQYTKKGGTVVNPAAVVAPNGGANNAPADPGGRLTKREAYRLGEQLRAKYGHGFNETPEYKAIWARAR
jgi:hypothetical protein